MCASENGHEGILHILIAAGVDLNIQGNKLLDYAVGTRRKDFPRYLISSVMLATYKGNVGLLRLLIDAGADLNVQDKIVSDDITIDC